MPSQPAPRALTEQHRLDLRSASRASEDWPRLAGTCCEVASLQRLFDSAPQQVVMDSDAIEQRLAATASKGELGRYSYVHLTKYGQVDNGMPLCSAVILAQDTLPDEPQRLKLLLEGYPIPDGRLTAEEVLRRGTCTASW